MEEKGKTLVSDDIIFIAMRDCGSDEIDYIIDALTKHWNSINDEKPTDPDTLRDDSEHMGLP